jgi:FixJ family two-component response regulator
MEDSREARILIVDDEDCICETLKSLISAWGMHPESATQPLSVLELIRDAVYDVFLLDIQMPGMSGFDLIQAIREHCPDAKTIMMTGYADKETAIRALQLGAFDFLEKPFQAEILYYTICRALDAVEKDRRLKKSYEDLKRSQYDLLIHKERLEYLNSQLMETNKALTILAKNFEREREEMERRIAMKLRTVIVPLIERLQRGKAPPSFETELNAFVGMVEDLTSSFNADAKIATSLSFAELRIASLIKNGVTTEDIARQLNISTSTVRTHRKNIRKKLKINNVRYSLRNFLSSKSDAASRDE